ncbi:heterodimeric methylmalonyl-CoA mutase small subunit [Flavobacteriaceae bacterium MAR_2010_72]|nr:heterodimeric methylmalonyl-CoA mutase small subunit [Flavobacteriaceae bacterium MAR_2010_72]TVZ60246.1 methylmalonyl-CoA mutase [Flavobacteriaceae bacterium MAR_2010_105]
MGTSLFDEFPEVSSKQWKQHIQFDLKGADYNDTLIWRTNEGIDVKPFYHADDFKTLPQVSNSKATQWHIGQSIFVADVEKSNIKALKLLNRGVESLIFIIPSKDNSIKVLLKDIDLDTTPVHLHLQFLDAEFVKQLANYSSSNLTIHTDIIGNLARTGNWFSTLQEDHKQFDGIVEHTRSFSIDTTLYQNAGATIVQQLAYAIAHANDYLNHLDTGISSEIKQSFNVTFHAALGSNYFFEIAKLCALRRLWHTLAAEYEVNTDCHIMVTPTKRNKTIYDYNTNMLRTTTECMSAILGGANTISNLAYDAIYHKSNAFGERIARNQLLILKHESYFDKVNNPSDGAYFIETLTNELSQKALELFKDIEANGGFLKQLKEGTIQRKISESSAREQEQFNKGELTLLGTNKHPNLNDRMKGELELYPFIKTNPRKTLIEPIIERRLAEALEQKRLKDE